jgi:hypothetical protein
MSYAQRIKAWRNEYTASILDPAVRGRRTPDDAIEHVVWGYELSRQLQAVLGPKFRIEYGFHTREGRRLHSTHNQTFGQ